MLIHVSKRDFLEKKSLSAYAYWNIMLKLTVLYEYSIIERI